jgi:hypothetical protein
VSICAFGGIYLRNYRVNVVWGGGLPRVWMNNEGVLGWGVT